ncbi:MAG: (d)CMP kinase [Clostridia bacterium]
MDHINIAIDGPAGAGKSTVAREVAKRLGILYLDTGAMYRAMALKAIRAGIEPADRAKVLTLLANTDISAKNNDGAQITYLDGEDVSTQIRTQQVSKGASDIAVIQEVREKLSQLQKRIATQSDVVMDGRDIGSCIMPDSKFKFFITASVEERARRRLLELQAKGGYIDANIESVCAEIEVRDHTDSTREFAPLIYANDAVLIDTTDMDIQSTIEAIMGYLQETR